MANTSLVSGTRVVGIGECVIDVLNKDGKQTRVPGGCPMNGAIALSRQGIRTAVLSPVSLDQDGKNIAKHLRESGVDISLLKPVPQPTTLAILTIDDEGNASYEFEMTNRSQSQWVSKDIYNGTHEGDILLVSGSFSLATYPMSRVFQELFREGAKSHVIYFDPNVRERIIGDDHRNIAKSKDLFDSWIEQSTIVKASSEDVAWRYPGMDLREAADLMVGDGNKLVFITDGPDSVIVASKKMGIFEVEVDALEESEIVDTVGAGDTFNAGVIKWLIENGKTTKRDIVELDRATAIKMVDGANCLAREVCKVAGANPPWKIGPRGSDDGFILAQ
ncbi:MAG TPA: PfkB family carbohydrate kinase [Acidimicrobiia bacterium]|nr:PfkB family carbohydrate kinase [Acidimicrobiia bacterium]